MVARNVVDFRTQESVNTRTSAVLEDIMTQQQMQHLGAIFKAADERGKRGLTIRAFRKAMHLTMGDLMTDEDLDMIFMKVRGGVVK